MDQHMFRRDGETVRDLATQLLQHGEQCALAGRVPQAEAILTQAWTIAVDAAPDIANVAAWDVGWLLVQVGAYRAAAAWFERVDAPRAGTSQLWAATRSALVRLCLDVAPPAPQQASRLNQHTMEPSLHAQTLPPLLIHSLGQFQIVRDGCALPPCKARKAILLLRYLLTRRSRSAAKEELMEIGWPDAHPHEAAHSLHVAISTLRRHLDGRGESYVQYEGYRYCLNAAVPITDDCATFQAYVHQGDRFWRAYDLERARTAYRAAVDMYGGDYAAHEREPAWAIAERERLLAAYLSALDHLGQILMRQQQWEEAAACFGRLLDRDGYREDTHALLMRCYWQLARRTAALRQYERCQQILAQDLGVEPMPALHELYLAMLRNDETALQNMQNPMHTLSPRL